MKIILLKDVPALGQRGDIKDVRPGYARNFLLARGLAKPATESALKETEVLRNERETKHTASDVEFEKALAAFAGRTVTIEAKATAKGNLYRAISKKQILEALKTVGISEIGESDLADEPVKKIGPHEIRVSRAERSGTFTLTIAPKP